MAQQPLIPDKDLQNLKEQLNNMQRDRDRVRLVQVNNSYFHFLIPLYFN